MLKKGVGTIVCLSVIFFMVPLSVQADNHEGEAKGAMSKEMQAQMERMQDYGTPGKEHMVLKDIAGDWTVSSKFWLDPKDKPQESLGESSFAWIHNNLFLKQEYKSVMNSMPFVGTGFIGYNKMKNQYESIWLDSMSSGIFKSSGAYHQASKTIKEEGSYSCPMTGETDRWHRSEWQITSKNKMKFAMYSKDKDGQEFKSMEMVYKRKK